MAEAVIVSAVRTPIGRAGKGVLKDVRADDLASIAVRAAVERVPQLDRSLIEDVILGCAFPEGEQGMNLARLVGALSCDYAETTADVSTPSSLRSGFAQHDMCRREQEHGISNLRANRSGAERDR